MPKNTTTNDAEKLSKLMSELETNKLDDDVDTIIALSEALACVGIDSMLCQMWQEGEDSDNSLVLGLSIPHSSLKALKDLLTRALAS